MEWLAMVAGVVVVSLSLYIVIEGRLRAAREDLGRRVEEGMVQFRGDLENVRQAMAGELRGVREEVAGNLSRMGGQMVEQLQKDSSFLTTTLGDLKKDLGALAQAAERIREVGKDISGLQQILQAPKTRGGLGELSLESLLSQIFPAGGRYYTLQHRFSDGTIVDATVRVGNNLVPIDAKFPLENFRPLLSPGEEGGRRASRRAFTRDVRTHIEDIASKYIRPQDGTYDFAFMYIPAENVYYEVIAGDEGGGGEQDIQAYAFQRRVLPVSPNTFYAYLRVIIMGLRGMQIEERAEEILKGLGSLRSDFERFSEEFRTLGTHVRNARNKYEDAQRELDRFDGQLTGISREALEEPRQIDGAGD